MAMDQYSRADYPAGFATYQQINTVRRGSFRGWTTPSISDTFNHSGLQPHVTFHHFDLPQALHDEYGRWLSRKIVKDFTSYAEVCFREFGDSVKFWTIVNEPIVFALGGYSEGIVPPGRCSP